MNHAKKKRGVPDAMSGTPLLSVVFYVVNKNPQNRIRSKSCKKQKKTPEIRKFQVLFCHVLIKKMHPKSLVPQRFPGFHFPLFRFLHFG